MILVPITRLQPGWALALPDCIRGRSSFNLEMWQGTMRFRTAPNFKSLRSDILSSGWAWSKCFGGNKPKWKEKKKKIFLLYVNTASLIFMSVFVRVFLFFFCAVCLQDLSDQGSNLGSGRAES